MAYILPLANWPKLEICLASENVTYEFKQGRSDGFMYETGIGDDGKAKFHIHSIEHVDHENMVFSKLLAKSSNWRNGDEPDLAGLAIADWTRACQGMDSSTLKVVNALSKCFDLLGAKHVDK